MRQGYINPAYGDLPKHRHLAQDIIGDLGSTTINQSKNPITYIVAKDGGGDFFEIQPALDASPTSAHIKVLEGIYEPFIMTNKMGSIVEGSGLETIVQSVTGPAAKIIGTGGSSWSIGNRISNMLLQGDDTITTCHGIEIIDSYRSIIDHLTILDMNKAIEIESQNDFSEGTVIDYVAVDDPKDGALVFTVSGRTGSFAMTYVHRMVVDLRRDLSSAVSSTDPSADLDRCWFDINTWIHPGADNVYVYNFDCALDRAIMNLRAEILSGAPAPVNPTGLTLGTNISGHQSWLQPPVFYGDWSGGTRVVNSTNHPIVALSSVIEGNYLIIYGVTDMGTWTTQAIMDFNIGVNEAARVLGTNKTVKFAVLQNDGTHLLVVDTLGAVEGYPVTAIQNNSALIGYSGPQSGKKWELRDLPEI